MIILFILYYINKKMENKKEITLIDLENNYYCLINDYIQIYFENKWYFLYLNFKDKEYEDLYLNLFEYHPQLKYLQYFKINNYPVHLLNKFDNYIIYNNNQYHNRKCLFNLFFNALTYYIVNYKQDKLNDYYNILKNNILYSSLRKYDKLYDYSFKFKSKNKNETLDKIFFKKDLLNDLYNLNLGIKFNFHNINCNNPSIKKIINYKYKSVYVFNNDDLIYFSYINKNNLNYLNNFSLNKIKIKNCGENKNDYIISNDNIRCNIFFENIIVDFPDQSQLIQKNIKMPILSPVNILSKSFSSSCIPSKHSSDLTSSDDTIDNNKTNKNKITKDKINKKEFNDKINKDVNKKDKTEEYKTEEDETEKNKIDKDKTEEDKTIEDEIDENKTIEDETDEDKTNEDKTNEEEIDDNETDKDYEENEDDNILSSLNSFKSTSLSLSNISSNSSNSSNSSSNNLKIKLNDIHKLKVKKPIEHINKKNQLLIGTIGNTLNIIDEDDINNKFEKKDIIDKNIDLNNYIDTYDKSKIIIVDNLTDTNDTNKTNNTTDNSNDLDSINEDIDNNDIKETKEDKIYIDKINNLIDKSINNIDKKELIDNIKEKIKELNDLINKL